MKIVCEFDSVAEMVGFAQMISGEDRKAVRAIRAEKTEESDLTASSSKDVEEDDNRTEETGSAEAVQESTEKTQPYTLVDVRAKLAELQKSGKRDQVKTLLEELGASKLSEVPEEKYGLLMKKAGEL